MSGCIAGIGGRRGGGRDDQAQPNQRCFAALINLFILRICDPQQTCVIIPAAAEQQRQKIFFVLLLFSSEVLSQSFFAIP